MMTKTAATLREDGSQCYIQYYALNSKRNHHVTLQTDIRSRGSRMLTAVLHTAKHA